MREKIMILYNGHYALRDNAVYLDFGKEQGNYALKDDPDLIELYDDKYCLMTDSSSDAISSVRAVGQSTLDYARQMAEIDNRLERLNSIFADVVPPVTRHGLVLSDGSQWRVSCDGRTRTRIQ